MPGITMEGKQIPNVIFKVFNTEGQWEDWKIRDLCSQKTVVIFSLPGAFTPTCSNSHLPRYEELYSTFSKNGVDDIYCLSVNDTFVMNSWASSNGITHVKMLPDGNGEFSDAMGMLVDKSGIGFGKRSWRYSMLVKDGVVKKIFVEPEQGADPYGVSDADTMLKFIKCDVKLPHQIVMLTKKGCPFCKKAKGMLEAKELHYVELPLSDAVRNYAVSAMTGKSTVPQTWIDSKLIGGSQELESWLASNAR